MVTMVLAPLMASAASALGGMAGLTGAALSAATMAGQIIGGVAGAAVDSLLFASAGSTSTGSRLSDKNAQDASYGTAIPNIIGRYRLSGNVIWAKELEEVKSTKKSGGNNGGTKTISYSYYGTFAVAICEGPVVGIRRIWADSKLIWDSSASTTLGMNENGYVSLKVNQTKSTDSTSSSTSEYNATLLETAKADAVRLYLGTEDQMPDPAIVSVRGPDKACAYRGTAYIVFERLYLDDWGRRIPDISVEIIGSIGESVGIKCYGGQNALTPANQYGGSFGRPFAMLDGKWSTVGIDGDGRLEVRTFEVDSDGTGLDLVQVYTGPKPDLTRVDCLMAEMSHDCKTIAVVAAKDQDEGTDESADGRLHLAAFSTDYGEWAPGDSAQPAIGWASSTGAATMWVGHSSIAVAACTKEKPHVKTFWMWSYSLVSDKWVPGDYISEYHPPAVSEWKTISHIVTGKYTSILLVKNGINSYMLSITAAGGTNSIDIFAMFSSSAGEKLSNHVELGGSEVYVSLPLHSNVEWTRIGGEGVALVSSGAFTGESALFSIDLAHTEPVIKRAPWNLPEGVRTAWNVWSSIANGRIAFCGLNYTTGGNVIYGEVALSGSDTFSVYTSANEVSSGETLVMSSAISRVAGSSATPGCIVLWPASGSALFLVKRSFSDPTMASAVKMVLDRYGKLDEADYDISAIRTDITIAGFAVSRQTTARAALTDLQSYQPFDIVECDGKLVAHLREGDHVAAIPDADGRAHDTSGGDSEFPVPFTVSRTQYADLPMDAAVRFMDIDRDFNYGTRRAQRAARITENIPVTEIPVAMKTGRAQDAVDQMIIQSWLLRETVEFTVSMRWAHLSPADIITYRGFTLRLTSVSTGSGVVTLRGVPFLPTSYGKSADVEKTDFVSARIRPVPSTQLMLLDLPALTDSDASYLGVYAGAASSAAWWPGCSVFRNDGGGRYDATVTLDTRLTVGTVEEVLPEADEAFWDNASVVHVRVQSGDLESLPEIDVLGGSNMALIGGEIVQYRDAELVSAGRYRLSGFLRGRKGTERFIAAHSKGERFVLLDRADMEMVTLGSADLGVPELYRAVTYGLTPTHQQDAAVTPGGETLRPLSPVHVTGSRADGGDLTVAWIRRVRSGGEWSPLADVRLDETTESYTVSVVGMGGAAVRTETVYAPTWTYTAAQQVADFGSLQASVSVAVAQVSSLGVGAGHAATATV